MSDDPKVSDGDLPTAIRSRAEFERALGCAMSQVLARRGRRMVWIDPDFDGWPLDQPALLEPLAQWLRLPQRRLVLMAHHFGTLERRHPRFVAWRRDWVHAVEAWTPSEGVEVRLPTLLIDDDHLCLQMFDTERWRGRLASDEHAVRQWTDEIDALLQRCEPAFPAHHLGL